MATARRFHDASLDSKIEAAQRLLDARGLIDSLATLVRIPSVHDPKRSNGNEEAAVDYLSGLLDGWRLPYTRHDAAPRRPNLIVDLPGGRPGPILILEGHTDVVTAGNRSAWSVDPFGAEIRERRMYGRGAVDMKGGLAAMIFAARAIAESGASYAGTIRLAILADEEGLMLGAKRFVRDGYLEGATAAIICEPEGDRVCIAQKGSIRIRAVLVGKMAHGAMPEEGANPIVALGEVIHACRALERDIQAECGEDTLLGSFYITPTVVLGGEREQGNVIPAEAELMLDIRTTSGQDHWELLQRVETAIDAAAGGVPGVSVVHEIVDDRPATSTDPDDPIVRAVVAAHERATGDTPPFGGVPGSTDGTIFWAATRIPLVTYGPGSTTLPHQADEYVDIDDVERYARTYIDAALNYFAMKEHD
ncbi:MAG TPA: M20 family metallopeptidase [Thermomicrobiales bacterium]|nr:M20 family metallopeptidase [Thermomicrobiales bacterium]